MALFTRRTEGPPAEDGASAIRRQAEERDRIAAEQVEPRERVVAEQAEERDRIAAEQAELRERVVAEAKLARENVQRLTEQATEGGDPEQKLAQLPESLRHRLLELSGFLSGVMAGAGAGALMYFEKLHNIPPDKQPAMLVALTCIGAGLGISLLSMPLLVLKHKYFPRPHTEEGG